jgi:hypothetical protein
LILGGNVEEIDTFWRDKQPGKHLSPINFTELDIIIEADGKQPWK